MIKTNLIIFFLLFGLNNILLADYTRANDVVTHNNTTLQWQDNNDSLTSLNWLEAIDYCEALSLNGFDDWRLPNVNELTSLIKMETGFLAIDAIFIYASPDGVYWTSTTSRNQSNAILVNFSAYGDYYLDWSKGQEFAYVRCVRN